MQERWKIVADFPDYEVSDLGRIRRCTTAKSSRPGRFRKLLLKDGYPYVVIGGRGLMVHRAVLYAFVGPPIDGQEARHLDGDRENNRLTNLRWGTRQENADDKARHGTQTYGELHPPAKLTEAQVREIRSLHGLIPLRELGRRYGVSHTAIRRAATGRTWARV